MKATVIKQINEPYGSGKLYKLSEPLEDNEYIAVMPFISSGFLGEPMTMVYPADEEGITSYNELAGSQVGVLSCSYVLNSIGYKEN